MIALGILALGCDRRCADLNAAAAGGDLANVERLVAAGAVVRCSDSDGWAPLHSAARAGHTPIAQWLLEHGADIEARGDVGRGPLYEAAKYDQLETARFLLDRGALVDARTDQQFTPLIVAAERGHRAVMELLLDRGADVNAANFLGDTPLAQLISHLSADDDTLVRMLIARGAWVDAHGNDGWTPLDDAARRGHATVVTTLLDSGANPSSVSGRSMLPIHHARGGHHQDVIAILEARATWPFVEGARTASPPASVTRGGVVVARSGPNAPALGERCEVTLRPFDGGGVFNCQLEAHCGERHLYGGGATGFTVCEETTTGWRTFDARGTPEDRDPSAMLDLGAGVFFADDCVPAPLGTSVQVRLDVSPAP